MPYPHFTLAASSFLSHQGSYIAGRKHLVNAYLSINYVLILYLWHTLLMSCYVPFKVRWDIFFIPVLHLKMMGRLTGILPKASSNDIRSSVNSCPLARRDSSHLHPSTQEAQGGPCLPELHSGPCLKARVPASTPRWPCLQGKHFTDWAIS